MRAGMKLLAAVAMIVFGGNEMYGANGNLFWSYTSRTTIKTSSFCLASSDDHYQSGLFLTPNAVDGMFSLYSSYTRFTLLNPQDIIVNNQVIGYTVDGPKNRHSLWTPPEIEPF